jgi:hypothetical protein
MCTCISGDSWCEPYDRQTNLLQHTVTYTPSKKALVSVQQEFLGGDAAQHVGWASSFIQLLVTTGQNFTNVRASLQGAAAPAQNGE